MNSREDQKTSNIARALCQFFLSKNCPETRITVTPCPSCYTIIASGKISLTEKEVAEITNLLEHPKTPEMDYYYDDLLVSGMNDNEFTLLGSMVNNAYVSYKEGILKIELNRDTPKIP